MTTDLTITMLGCGPSGGVPLIGCQCAVCASTNPKNHRGRASILVESDTTRLLVDTSPDLREQALREGIKTVDAIFYTHVHADHCHGIDDARSFNFHRNAALPVYGTAEIVNELRQRFGYAFHAPQQAHVWARPSLELQEINEYDEITVGNIDIFSYVQHHGKHRSTGYRFENVGYSPDVHNYPEQSTQLLEKLDVWIVDCLQFEPAPTHAHLALTLEWIKRFTPKLAVLTHMSHALEYEALSSQLPPSVVPAYDGMKIKVVDGVPAIIR